MPDEARTAKSTAETNQRDRTDDALDIICLSLEAWDEVWRRNQFFAAAVLRMRPDARILFVEPNIDVPWAIRHRLPIAGNRLRPIGDSGRLWAVSPRKWLPRRLYPHVDRSLSRQVLRAARRLDMHDPVYWVNDSGYAALLDPYGSTPSVYDVTDDWILGALAAREQQRQRQNDAQMLGRASEVVVCSPNLVATRGAKRTVHLVPNGVDVAHLQRPQPRPTDVPTEPYVLYAGTLSAGRLDLSLCVDLARSLSPKTRLVFVGPNALSPADSQELIRSGALLLGARAYRNLPGYLQHAAVFVNPHVVSPFTESLDPIKAREYLAVGRPTVSTPVAGFRKLGPPVHVARASDFVEAVITHLRHRPEAGLGPLSVDPGSWDDRAGEFLAILESARSR